MTKTVDKYKEAYELLTGTPVTRYTYSWRLRMNQNKCFDSTYEEDVLHEECGVFGMYDFDGDDVASSGQNRASRW